MERDTAIRHQAFTFVERLRLLHGDGLPWGPLATEFVVDGVRIPLIGQRGIWKPAALDVPISITTSPKDPYGDKLHDDGFLHYRYFGVDPSHPDNTGLRRAMHEEIPLVYFHGISKGVYSALWPAFIVADDPATLTFTVACEDVQMIRPDRPGDAGGEIRHRVCHTAGSATPPPSCLSPAGSKGLPDSMHRVHPASRAIARCGAHPRRWP